MDRLLGKIMGKFDVRRPENTLIVMSDHGFAPFRRQVNLNSWLCKKGYLSLTSPSGLESDGFFEYVDWSSTVAYNIGINSIYLIISGRESKGVLKEAQIPYIVKSLKNDLMEMIELVKVQKAVSDVWITPENHRQSNPHAPDLIVGWRPGYRCSWESIIGGGRPDIIKDNADRWSGDHCIDPRWVPAICLCNEKIVKDHPTLHDLTASILSEFRIPIPDQMVGRPIYQFS